MEGPQRSDQPGGRIAPDEIMSGKTDKKIRKVAHLLATHSGREYADSICHYPFRNKLRYCWDILTHKEWH